MSTAPSPKSEAEQVEVWRTLQEAEWRSEDRKLQEKLAGTPWYKSALIVGIMLTAVTIAGNTTVSFINHSNTLKTENFKAEGQRVLQALEAGSSDQAASNLQLLRDAKLITGKLDGNIAIYLKNRNIGEGAVIGTPRIEPAKPGLTLEFKGDQGGPTIVVMVGHDRIRSNGFSPYLGMQEYDYTYPLAISLAEAVRDRGGTGIVLTRIAGKSSSLQNDEIAERALSFAANYVVELHFNGAANSTVEGTEVYVAKNGDVEFGQRILGSITAALGTKGRGVKDGGRMAILRRLEQRGLDGALVELFFGSNPVDSRKAIENRAELIAKLATVLVSK